jgi:hypothetical protein
MNKSLLLIILLAFALEMGCQNGHKSQSWHPGTPGGGGKAKRR